MTKNGAQGIALRPNHSKLQEVLIQQPSLKLL